MTASSSFSLTGIGLRTPHYSEILQKLPPLAFLEVHSENYFVEGGKPLYFLEKLREHYPISLHSISSSLGSTDELNWHHLKKLKELVQRIDPCFISDHLCWSSIEGRYLHDLLPMPYTEEALSHMVARIQQVQEFLNQSILIENVSSYVQYRISSMPEWQFLTEVAQQSGCGILLDINNIYVNSMNHDFDPESYLAAIPSHLVKEMHLAGFSTNTIHGKEILIDTHNRPVVPGVWELYRMAVQHLGQKPTLIEWDKDIPSLDTLCSEAYRAEKIRREHHVITSVTN